MYDGRLIVIVYKKKDNIIETDKIIRLIVYFTLFYTVPTNIRNSVLCIFELSTFFEE